MTRWTLGVALIPLMVASLGCAGIPSVRFHDQHVNEPGCGHAHAKPRPEPKSEPEPELVATPPPDGPPGETPHYAAPFQLKSERPPRPMFAPLPRFHPLPVHPVFERVSHEGWPAEAVPTPIPTPWTEEFDSEPLPPPSPRPPVARRLSGR